MTRIEPLSLTARQEKARVWFLPLLRARAATQIRRELRIDDRTEALICQGVAPDVARQQAEIEESDAA